MGIKRYIPTVILLIGSCAMAQDRVIECKEGQEKIVKTYSELDQEWSDGQLVF